MVDASVNLGAGFWVAHASTVATDGGSWPTGIVNQRRTFYANGRHWVFYYDGTNMVWRTSTDGLAWSGKTTVRAVQGSQHFNIFFDGTYVHYAQADEWSDSTIRYRRGTPNAAGTITWSAVEQTVRPSARYVNLGIAVDEDGYPFVSYLNYEVGAYYPYAVKSDNNNGTWSGSETPAQLSTTSNSGWWTGLAPLLGGKIYAIYTRDVVIAGRLYNGSSWENEETIDSNGIQIADQFSICTRSDSDWVYLVYTDHDTYDFNFRKRSPSTGWGAIVQIYNNADSFWAAALSVASDGTFYVFWLDVDNDILYYQTSADDGASWSTPSPYSEGNVGVQRSLNSSHTQGGFFPGSSLEGDIIGVIFQEGSSRVRYSFLEMASQIGWDTLAAGFTVRGAGSASLGAGFTARHATFLDGRDRTYAQISDTLEGAMGYIGFNSDYQDHVNYRLCDGTADDVQIAEAIALGSGDMKFETGTYDITAALVMADDRHLLGAGREQTILRASAAIARIIDMAGADDVYIAHLTLEGNSQATDIISGSAATGIDFRIFDCKIRGATQYGIRYGTGITASYCVFLANGDAGTDVALFIDGSFSAKVSDCYFYNNYRDITVSTGSYAELVNIETSTTANRGISLGGICSLSNFIIQTVNGDHGIYVSDGISLISNGQIDTTISQGIHIQAGTLVLIGTVHITGAGNHGIRTNIDDIQIENCRIDGSGGDGIYLNNADDCIILGNTITGSTGYGINIITGSLSTIVKNNKLLGNTAGCINDNGTGTILPTIKGEFPLSNVGGGAAAVAPVINTSPGGIDIDANDEFAHIKIPLPNEVQQVVRIKIWAYANIVEADKMRLRIVSHGAGDNEPWSGNAVDVANHPSETENFAALDVVHWSIDEGDDAQIGTLAAQDFIELLAIGEVAGDGDCLTDALFGGYSIEHV